MLWIKKSLKFLKLSYFLCFWSEVIFFETDSQIGKLDLVLVAVMDR